MNIKSKKSGQEEALVSKKNERKVVVDSRANERKSSSDEGLSSERSCSSVRRSPITRVREMNERAGKHFDTLFVKRWSNLKNVRLWILEWGLLNLVIILLAFVQVFWYADAYRAKTFIDGGEFSEATLGQVNSLNPLYASTSSEKTLSRLLFANLMAPDTTGHMKNILAKEVRKVDDDPSRWRLTLRDNLVWSDGEPITTDDLLFTIDLINSKEAKTTVISDFSSVNIEQIDEKTVQFNLSSPYTDFTDTLEFPLIPKHAFENVDPALVYESDFSKNPICSGVFKFNAMQSSNSSSKAMQIIYLAKNDKHYLSGAHLNSFTLKTYSSLDDIKEAFENAEVTATAELNLGTEFNRSLYAERDSELNAGVFAFFNVGRQSAAGDNKFRTAVRQGVNMDAVRGEILKKHNLDYPILSKQLPGAKFPELPEYNLDKAKKALQEAGYAYDAQGMLVKDNQIVQLSVAYRSGGEMGGVADRFVNELRVLGVQVELNIFGDEQVAAGQDFYTTVVQPRNYDILLYKVDLGVSADPIVYYNSRQVGEYSRNLSNYDNKLADDAMVSARTTSDMDLRRAKYESFLNYWVNDVPAIGIYRSVMPYYYADNVQIYTENIEMTDELDRFSDLRSFATQKGEVNLTP